MGILSRFTVKYKGSFTPRRTMVSFTSESFGPRRRVIISSVDIFTPAIALSFTATIRSPARIPTFSDGPLLTGCIISNVSSIIWNCTPIPSKLPCNGSFIFFTSSASLYVECGSSWASIRIIASSTNLFSSTESTYRLAMANSAICNLRAAKLPIFCACMEAMAPHIHIIKIRSFFIILFCLSLFTNSLIIKYPFLRG